MATSKPISRLLIPLLGAVLISLSALTSGCIVEPREGFYDRDHHRWYHEHSWRECGEGEERCRG